MGARSVAERGNAWGSGALDTNRCSWLMSRYDEHTVRLGDPEASGLMTATVPVADPGRGTVPAGHGAGRCTVPAGDRRVRPGPAPRTGVRRPGRGLPPRRPSPTVGGRPTDAVPRVPAASIRGRTTRAERRCPPPAASCSERWRSGLLVALALPWSGPGATPRHPRSRPGGARPSPHSVYVVQPGDTLWSIAERLDPHGRSPTGGGEADRTGRR